jgi:hypothetical protein
MTNKLLAPSVFVLVLLLAVYGCNSPDDDAPATSTTPIPAEDVAATNDHSGHDHGDSHAGHDSHAGDDYAGHDEGAKKTDMEKMTESLASFSPEDRASAMKQHFCPVSGEMLGTMGAPEKVDVNGQPVWICCDGCKDKLLADPEKYLAKIAK